MTNNHSIFVASSSFGLEAGDFLKKSGYPYSLNSTGRRLSSKELADMGQEAVAMIAGLEPYDAYVLEHCQRLRCISRCGVGVDNIDFATAQKRGVKVFTTPDVVVGPVAEMTIAMILDLMRSLSQHLALMREGRWERLMGEQLAGKTVGVLGLGRIGRKVAELLIGLDAKVIGYDIAPDTDWAARCGVKLVSLDDLISTCDILTLHLAVSEHNPFCLKEEQLAHMKRGAFVVNVSRGSFIDEGALETVLRRGHLAGAALDVYQQEPYQGSLRDLPNVILTPHVATFTRQSRLQMEIQATENVISFLNSL